MLLWVTILSPVTKRKSLLPPLLSLQAPLLSRNIKSCSYLHFTAVLEFYHESSLRTIWSYYDDWMIKWEKLLERLTSLISSDYFGGELLCGHCFLCFSTSSASIAHERAPANLKLKPRGIYLTLNVTFLWHKLNGFFVSSFFPTYQLTSSLAFDFPRYPWNTRVFGQSISAGNGCGIAESRKQY